MINKATAKGPINIALIKYWGKENEDDIIPLNNSISLTLDMDTFYTQTEVQLIIDDEVSSNNIIDIRLKINEKESPVTKRIQKIIDYFMNTEQAKTYLSQMNPNNKNIKLIINSYNTFPISSGCASSASSMSALVVALNKLFNTNLPTKDLSKLARVGSGSACRSIISGIAEWNKDAEDSFAYQLYDQNYWNINVMLIIVNQDVKNVSSAQGMNITKNTSKMFKYRVESIVEAHISQIKNAMKNKDFKAFAEVVMKDSNNFHCCCLDSYPCIMYMNDDSKYIIECVNFYNAKFGVKMAYSIDAGANVFIVFEGAAKDEVNAYFNFLLFGEGEIEDLKCEKLKEAMKGRKEKYRIVNFRLGEGAN